MTAQATKYDALITELQAAEDHKLVINANVTADGLRKGLRKALASARDFALIMEEDFPFQSVSVVSKEPWQYEVCLRTEKDSSNTQRFKEKFDFQVVGDEDGT